MGDYLSLLKVVFNFTEIYICTGMCKNGYELKYRKKQKLYLILES